jgi:hypothetical protein
LPKSAELIKQEGSIEKLRVLDKSAAYTHKPQPDVDKNLRCLAEGGTSPRRFTVSQTTLLLWRDGCVRGCVYVRFASEVSLRRYHRHRTSPARFLASEVTSVLVSGTFHPTCKPLA